MKKTLTAFILLLLSISLFSSCIKRNPPIDNIDEMTSIDYSVIYYDVANDRKINENETFEGSPEFMLIHILGRISELTQVSFEYNHVSIDTDQRSIIVDFKNDAPPTIGLGSASEAAVLDSIAETFFENYPEIDKVFYTSDGIEYSSGHVRLEMGEAYRTRPVNEE